MLPIKVNFLIILLFCTLNHGVCAKFLDVDVGIVVDMESWTGKAIYSSIIMAKSEFYAQNDGYKTRIVIHARDSKGDQLQAMSNVLDLVNTVKVHAIVGPETFIGSELLGSIATKSEVPMFTFAGKSSMKYPYMFHIKEDELSVAKSIVALIEYYTWTDVIFLREETDDGLDTLQNLFELFQDSNIRITYVSVISSSDQIVAELHKIMSFHTTVIIVDMSPSLASKVFVNAKKLGMMSKDFAWILSPKTVDILQSTNFEVIDSLQGSLGIRSYIPTSSRLHHLRKKWNKKFSRTMPTISVWAFDTIWALAESIERVGVPLNGSILLNEIMRTKFEGVSGEFQLSERHIISNEFEIVNAVDHGEKRVGYWTLSDGIRKSHVPSNNVSLKALVGIEDVIWPGDSTNIPKGWILRMRHGNRLRIGVRTGLRFKLFVNAIYDNQTNVTTAEGFSVDVFNTCIQAILPYEDPYEFVPFANGSYDALIQKVYNKEIDGLLGDSTILANRSEFVDFTATYTDLGLGTLVKIKKKDMWIFLKPLDRNLWLTFAVSLILTGISIWAIEMMNQESKCSSLQVFGTVFWLILLTIFFAQREKLESNISRFVMFVWLIVILILITSYTATLASLLTVEQFEQTSKGAIVGIHGGSFFGGVIVNNMNFSSSKHRLYYSYDDYADALTKGGKHGGADAIVDEVPYIKMFLGKYSSDYAMVSSEPITSGFGFIFEKGSPLVPLMSREIAKIREDGTLAVLEKKWVDSQYDVLPKDSSSEPQILSLDRFGGLFVISAVSSGLGLMIAMISLIRAKMEIHSIITHVVGQNLMATIRYLLHRNVIHGTK